MTGKPDKPKLTGVTSFSDDDDTYIAPPSKAVREKAKAENGAHGFISEKAAAAPESSKGGKRGNQRGLRFTHMLTIRVRPEVIPRFDDFAYRHRLAKGDAFSLLLDIAEGRAPPSTDKDE